MKTVLRLDKEGLVGMEYTVKRETSGGSEELHKFCRLEAAAIALAPHRKDYCPQKDSPRTPTRPGEL